MMKAVIFYYSNSGKTKKIAENIKKDLGCEMISIEPEVSYGSYFKAIARSRKEKKSGEVAKYFAPVIDISDVDVILVGYPVWFSKPPVIVTDYLKKYNLEGKRVVPFATSGSTNVKATLKALEESIGNAKIQLPFNHSIINKTNYAKWIEDVKKL